MFTSNFTFNLLIFGIIILIIILIIALLVIVLIKCKCDKEQHESRGHLHDGEDGSNNRSSDESNGFRQTPSDDPRFRVVPVGKNDTMARAYNRHEINVQPLLPEIPIDPDHSQVFGLQFHQNSSTQVVRPHEIKIPKLNPKSTDDLTLDRIRGSMIALAVGDALGAPVEFRPYAYMQDNPVTDYLEGGTWGLAKGQFTDDTSMTLCLAASLISCRNFSLYDQLVRYKWWYRHGYMSSTGECFDIGASTRIAVQEFEKRQTRYAEARSIPIKQLDLFREDQIENNFNFKCGQGDAAGNGSLMRLAPVSLFYYRDPTRAVFYCGESSLSTHGDKRAVDACRFYGALIVGAIRGYSKAELLDPNFYDKNRNWFGNDELVNEVKAVAQGSYKRKPQGHPDGIRGAGFVVASLEAALWAFANDNDRFEEGVLKVIGLGDDTDTTATIYGQLAGAYYGYNALPKKWIQNLYAKNFIEYVAHLIHNQGKH